jgi:hypothetical protein
MADTTQYIVTVNGSPHDGYTSHIEKVLLPNGVSTKMEQSAAIKAQLQEHIQKYLKEHPEKVQILVRFIVTVKGSPHNGYTAEIEEIQPHQPAQPQIKPPTKEELKKVEKEKEDIKEQKEKVAILIAAAANAARVAAFKVVDLFKATNSNIVKNTCKEAKDAADNAVDAADAVEEAIMMAEKELKDLIMNKITESEVLEAQANSDNAKKAVKNAVDSIIKNGVYHRELADIVKKAVGATNNARNLWEIIGKKMPPSLKGGYRNHTYRNHKKRKHKTIRKS